jgi:serine/threonine protein kinase
MNSDTDNLTKQERIKLLSQGTYGCVFKPGVNCKGNIENPKFITKIQNSYENSENETIIGSKIKKIKKYSSYFAPILKTCNISLGKIKDDEIEKCEVIEEKNKKYISNKIKYVGKDTLYKFFSHFHVGTPKLFIRKFLESYFDLIKAVTLLNNSNILHLDLKENNIMFDEKREKPIIIDFGLSLDSSELKPENYQKHFFVYAYDYPPWCFDISVVSYAVNELDDDWATKTATKDDFKKLIDNFVKNPIFEEYDIFTKDDIEKYKEKTMGFFADFDGVKWSVVVDEFMKYNKTWDVYAIHVIFLLFTEIYSFDENGGSQTSIHDYPFITEYIAILKREILALPEERKDKNALFNEIGGVFRKCQRMLTKKLLRNFEVNSKSDVFVQKTKKSIAKAELDELTKEKDMKMLQV